MNETRLSAEELQRLRQTEFSGREGFLDGSQQLADCVGEKGSVERTEFDAKAMAWYYGEILRNRRKELQMTQKELAERVGKERTYINRIERGETDMQLSSFLRISQALGIRLRMDVSIA